MAVGDEEAELEAARWLLFETMIQSGPLWEMKICARLPAGDECVFGVWKAAAALLGEPFDEADPKRSASGLMRDFKGFLDRLQDLPAAAQRGELDPEQAAAAAAGLEGFEAGLRCSLQNLAAQQPVRPPGLKGAWQQHLKYTASGQSGHRVGAECMRCVILEALARRQGRGRDAMAPQGRAALRGARPAAVSAACRAFFAQQAVAGESGAYCAVGSADYRTGDWSLLDFVRSLPAHRRASLRVLDLGTGDGHVLHSLNALGIPWSHLVGISAEDMREQAATQATKALGGEPPLCGRVPDESYFVVNIDELSSWSSEERKFDLIVSAVCFCWLTDPLAALETAHDKLLAEDGLMIIGSLQMPVEGVEPIEDQRYLHALAEQLIQEGHEIALGQDPGSPYNVWWVQCKRAAAGAMRLSGIVEYGGLLQNKVVSDSLLPSECPADILPLPLTPANLLIIDH